MAEPSSPSLGDKQHLYRAAGTAAIARRFGASLKAVPCDEIHANLTLQVACEFGGRYAALLSKALQRSLPPREEERLFDECVERVSIGASNTATDRRFKTSQW